jgi:integrase
MVCKKCNKELPEGSVFCCWCGAKQIVQHKRKVRSNGEGSVYQTSTGTWKAEVNIWRDGVRCRSTRAGFKTRREALDALQELREAALIAREHPNNITLEQLWAKLQVKWLPTLSRDKVYHYRTAWKRLAPLANAKIRNLRYADMQPIIDALGEQYYPAKDVKALLRRMFDLALKLECAEKDYAALLDLPPNNEKARRSLTMAEVDRIWADYDAGHKETGYFLIMAYTGMRTGELLTLPLADVRLKQQMAIGGIKTDAGREREIVFCDRIMPLVREACKDATKRLCELPEKTFYANWAALCSRIDLEDADPYCLRHTTASLLAHEHVSPLVIQKIMGHKDYAITAEKYTDVSLEDKLDAVNKI